MKTSTFNTIESAPERIQQVCEMFSELIPAVLVLTDEHSRIMWCNQRFTDLTGYTLEEILGKKPRDFLHGPETNQKTIQHINKCVKTHTPFDADVLNYRKDGTSYWVRLTHQPIYCPEQKQWLWFGTKWDITHEVELRDALDVKAGIIAKFNTRTKQAASSLDKVLKSIDLYDPNRKPHVV